MRNRFDEDGGPDIKVVVAEYRDAMRKRMRWVGPAIGGLILLILAWQGTYSVNPGEVGVVRTFGKESNQSQPGLHFRIPIVQQVNIVDLARVRRAEIGFRSSGDGAAKRVDSEALMLTGDENIIEAQMIVQYQIQDPSKYLFRLADPEKTLHAAAEVALRGVVGQMRITSSIEELAPSENPAIQEAMQGAPEAAEDKAPEGKAPDEGADDKEGEDAGVAEGAEKDGEEAEVAPSPQMEDLPETLVREQVDPETDILTKGRERAQVMTREMLQKLMDLYESGIRITEVKLQVVDAPDEVKDAFHDVVRAREEREQLINKALGYREDRIPKARGEAQKIIRAAEAYKRERVLRAEGEAARFRAILAEYRKARAVTRERLHLETMERILKSVPNKVFIDEGVAQNALPLLNLGGGKLPVAPQGGE